MVCRKIKLLLLAVLAVSGVVVAAEPSSKSDAIGRPVSIDVVPGTFRLDGPRATQQLLVTGHYADGSLRDLTGLADFQASNPGFLEVDTDGLVRGSSDGSTRLIVEVGGRKAMAEATVA